MASPALAIPPVVHISGQVRARRMVLDLGRCSVELTRYWSGKLSLAVVTLSAMGGPGFLPVVSVRKK